MPVSLSSGLLVVGGGGIWGECKSFGLIEVVQILVVRLSFLEGPAIPWSIILELSKSQAVSQIGKCSFSAAQAFADIAKAAGESVMDFGSDMAMDWLAYLEVTRPTFLATLHFLSASLFASGVSLSKC